MAYILFDAIHGQPNSQTFKPLHCLRKLDAVLNVRVHLLISGQVQGVFFRYETQEVASAWNVTGWVRNLRDGRVEAVLEGEEPNVEEVIRFCHQGPPGARVEKVTVDREPYKGEFDDFEIRR
ncbi:MAG: acylphosphatase [Candidatus Bathyarchaeia archaeon]